MNPQEPLPPQPPAGQPVPQPPTPSSTTPPTNPAAPNPELHIPGGAAPAPQVDVNQLFAPKVPTQQSFPQQQVNTDALFAHDTTAPALPAQKTPYVTESPVSTSASRFSKPKIAMAIVVAAGLAFGSFLMLKPKGDDTLSSQSAEIEAEVAAGVEDGSFLATPSESADAGSSDSSDKPTSSNGSSNNPSGDSGNSSGGGSSSGSSSGGTESSSNSGGNTNGSPAKPTGSTAATLKCINTNTSLNKHLTQPALDQAAKSVLAARGGASASLLSWVPSRFVNEAKGRHPDEINASFKRIKPTNCKVEFAYSVPKTVFSERAVVMIVHFDKTAVGGKYFAHINVAYAKNAWRTYGMSEAVKVQ